ncbi:MAG: response regulator [Spirochaetota bacterium]
MSRTILVVDDEANVRLFLRELFQEDGWMVFEAGTAKEGIAEARKQCPSIVLLDLLLPDADGLALINEFKGIDKLTEVIVITAVGTVDNAVQAMKNGAYDFITKPFDIEKIQAVHRRDSILPSSAENL